MSYHWTQKVIHWAVFACLLALVPAGLLIEGYQREVVERVDGALGKGAFNVVYDLHKSLGLTVLGLMILRVAARAAHGAPPYARPLKAWERVASGGVHLLLYALLIAAPIAGWVGVSAFPAPVPFFFIADLALPVAENRAYSEWLLQDVHGPLAIMAALLACAHIAAAFKHRLIDRDGVFARMTR